MKSEMDRKAELSTLSREQLVDLILQMDHEFTNLQAVNEYLKKKLFGVKKSDSAVKGQLTLFNEAEATVDEAEDAGQTEEPAPAAVRKKKKGRNARLKNVQVEERHIELSDTACPACGRKMAELAPMVKEYLEYRPAEYVLVRYIIHQYTCHACNEENMDCETHTGDTSALPARLIEGSFVTPSVVANVASDKFMLGIPFCRKSKELEYRGIQISRQNLCRWMLDTGEMYVKPVFLRMCTDMRLCGVLNMDETTLEVLEDVRDGRSESYTWLGMSGKYEENQMALYFYHASREHSFLREILGDSFSGVIQSDGYQAYTNYEGAKNAGCAAHAQRKFTEAAQSYTVLYKEYVKAKEAEKKRLIEENPHFGNIIRILDLFTGIYKAEKEVKEAEPEVILQVRKEKEEPLWKRIYEIVDQINSGRIVSDKLKKAVTYMVNQKEYLLYYINDWRIAPDNNLAEREGIKPYVMARKNYLFADTRRGAEISAMYFSMLVSARMNSLNPEKYLTYVLKELSTYGLRDEVIARCLPYSKELPDELKITKNHSR